MIIIFLKYYSVYNARIAVESAKEEAAAKEAAEIRPSEPVDEVIPGESLG